MKLVNSTNSNYTLLSKTKWQIPKSPTQHPPSRRRQAHHSLLNIYLPRRIHITKWRNQKKKQQKNSAGGYPTTTARSKFTGRTPELKDRNFTMGANSGAIFSRSKKEYLIRVSRKNVDIEKYIAQGAPRQFKYPMMPQVPNPNYA